MQANRYRYLWKKRKRAAIYYALRILKIVMASAFSACTGRAYVDCRREMELTDGKEHQAY